jgi:hypothetical protein
MGLMVNGNRRIVCHIPGLQTDLEVILYLYDSITEQII